MVGLGETSDEVINTMKQVHDVGVSIFTIGQYLRPTKNHLKVQSYVSKNKFDYYKNIGLKLVLMWLSLALIVRSSYHADEQARLAISLK